MAIILHCPSCGASIPRPSSQCEYCQSYLVHLSPFERRKSPAPETSKTDFKYFRSLRPLYLLAIAGGIAAFVYIYPFHLYDFSETELVQFSPYWFLTLYFGVSGLFIENAVKEILAGQAKNLTEGLLNTTRKMDPVFAWGVYLVFFPLFFLFLLKRIHSPFFLSLISTAIWGVPLLFFLVSLS